MFGPTVEWHSNLQLAECVAELAARSREWGALCPPAPERDDDRRARYPAQWQIG